jgi:hypothetical protein
MSETLLQLNAANLAPEQPFTEMGPPQNPNTQELANIPDYAVQAIGKVAVDAIGVGNFTGITETIGQNEVLQTPLGLEVTIEDPIVAAETSRQLTTMRGFLRGDIEAGKQISVEAEASTPEDAFKLVSDLGALHVLPSDFESAEQNLVSAGSSKEEAHERRVALEASVKARVADVLSESIRGTDLFLHDISTAAGWKGVLESGSLKSKPKMMQEGIYNSVTGSAQGVIDVESLKASAAKGFDSKDGLHSLLVHTRQRASVEDVPGSAFSIYLPAPSIIERTPYITCGQDVQNQDGGIKNRITGKDEAHGGGTRNRFAGVKINASEEYLATLPPAVDRELVEDVTFMANTEDARSAGTYEYSVEDAVVTMSKQGMNYVAKELSQREDIPVLTPRIREKYLSDPAKVLALQNEVKETRNDIAAGEKFEDMEYAAPESKELFRKLIGHADVVEAELRAALPQANLANDKYTKFISQTAILRTLVPHFGRSEQWASSNVYATYEDLDHGPEGNVIGDMIARKIQPPNEKDVLYIQSGASVLQFKQKDMAQAAVDSYVEALAA